MDERKTITLIVTEKCDLACTYCYEHKKSAKNMSFETAKRILDKELVDEEYSSFMIEFFGGEPFLNFELIKEIVDYVNLTYATKDVHFFATTNGTQVHGEIEHWLRKHVNQFTLGLSFDGVEAAQNINRSNSFNKINLQVFKELYSMQSIKMTISEATLPMFFESIKFLTEYGFQISCNLAYMVDWTKLRNRQILEEQLDLLIEYYINHPNYKKCSMLDYDIAILAHPLAGDKYVKKFCGCGTHMRVYDIDGICYPCQLFSPIADKEKAIPSKDFHIDRDIPKHLYPKECNECYYERICSFCLGSNYLSTADMFKPDFSRCELNKIIFKANAKLKALEWEKGLLKHEDEQGLLRSIVEILG